jgi:hypothetical protein
MQTIFNAKAGATYINHSAGNLLNSHKIMHYRNKTYWPTSVTDILTQTLCFQATHKRNYWMFFRKGILNPKFTDPF